MNIEDQKAAWLAKAYPHQKVWFESRDQPYRNILVERQCGITTAMAVEAYIQAKESGCLQVMIAPTVSQAEIFRQYILQYLEVSAEDLKSCMLFMSPKTFLAGRGYSNFAVYFCDYLWMKPDVLADLERVLAKHYKSVRQTWFSARTPDIKHRLLEQVTHKHDGGGESIGYGADLFNAHIDADRLARELNKSS